MAWKEFPVPIHIYHNLILKVSVTKHEDQALTPGPSLGWVSECASSMGQRALDYGLNFSLSFGVFFTTLLSRTRPYNCSP